MVSLISDESVLRILIERLNCPVRMAKWRTACEYGALLSSNEHYERAIKVFLTWLASRSLESEVVSALAVLISLDKEKLPPFELIRNHIAKPSILADIMLQSLYGAKKIRDGWQSTHSGEAPYNFKPHKFFKKNKTSHVPPILNMNINEIEKLSRLPFIKQWAYEWSCIMDLTDSPYSGFPYDYINISEHRAGIRGEFSQRQCDVYRSAYLRTLACGVALWEMPIDIAKHLALACLPVNLDFINLKPINRPEWLSNIPEIFVNTETSCESSIREITKVGVSQKNMRCVSLKTPITIDIAEFSLFSITAVLASKDFVFDKNNEWNEDRGFQWNLPDEISFHGQVNEVDINSYIMPGMTGSAIPLCLDLFPNPVGFWHNDYFQTTITAPAPYILPNPPFVKCYQNRVSVLNEDIPIAHWYIWHDHWTPFYMNGSTTRCGTFTELSENVIINAMKSHDMRLGWITKSIVWKQEDDWDSKYILKQKSEFFFD